MCVCFWFWGFWVFCFGFGVGFFFSILGPVIKINKLWFLSCKTVISMRASYELHTFVIGILLCILFVKITKPFPKCQDVL